MTVMTQITNQHILNVGVYEEQPSNAISEHTNRKEQQYSLQSYNATIVV